MYEPATIFRDNESTITDVESDMVIIGRVAEQIHNCRQDIGGSALMELVCGAGNMREDRGKQVYSARSKSNSMSTDSSDASLEQVLRCWGASRELCKQVHGGLLENGGL